MVPVPAQQSYWPGGQLAWSLQYALPVSEETKMPQVQSKQSLFDCLKEEKQGPVISMWSAA
jgi:hypothetical protein